MPMPTFEADRETLDLWAKLRGRASLAQVADMLRQDMEAEDLDTDEAEQLVISLAEIEATANVHI